MLLYVPAPFPCHLVSLSKILISRLHWRSRFLRARKFDVPAAKKMWVDTQKWKQSFHVDELYETFEYSEKPQVDKLYPR